MRLETAKSEKENWPARMDHRSCSFIPSLHSVTQQIFAGDCVGGAAGREAGGCGWRQRADRTEQLRDEG